MNQGPTDRFGDSRRRYYPFIFTVAAIAVPVGIVLWISWGHGLHYNVYANSEVWYQEEFPRYFKVIVTSFLSVIFGLVIVTVIAIVRHLMRRP